MIRGEVQQKIESSNPKEVNLTNMAICDNEITEIIQCVIRTKPHVKQLILSHNQIGDSGANILGQFCSQLTELNIIDLQHNQIDKEGVKALAGLESQLPSLELCLFDNKIHYANEMMSKAHSPRR